LGGYEVTIVSDTVTPKLVAWKERLIMNVTQELDRSGQDMEDLAKQLVPVRTGFLQSTIAHRIEETDLILEATADYASFVEFGTRMMSARPYIRPAVEAFRDPLYDGLLAAVMNTWEGR
jgi:HK97 gp10 family phage protein